MKRLLACALLGGFAINAQADLTDYLRETEDYKFTFAVYDIRPATMASADLEKIILTAVRTYATKAQVSHAIPPNPFPMGAPKMELNKVARWGMELYDPKCSGEIFSITAMDTDMAQYGEMTGSKVCLFPYQGGYRLNYYGTFIQRSGSDSPNLLGAALGRLVTKAVGLGDSSRFMKDTLDKIETDLKATGADIKLVELFPAMEGKTVVADPAPKLEVSPPPQAAVQGAVAPQMAVAMPPQLAQLQAMLAVSPEYQQMLAQRRQMEAAMRPAEPQPSINPALQARKDLAAMGLNYHSQDDFLDAIKRGDKLAVDLFLKADAVDVNAQDASGQRPLALAKRADVADMLKTYGAK